MSGIFTGVVPDIPNIWYYFRPKAGNMGYNGGKELINV
jgi:hypothetical protein